MARNIGLSLIILDSKAIWMIQNLSISTTAFRSCFADVMVMAGKAFVTATYFGKNSVERRILFRKSRTTRTSEPAFAHTASRFNRARKHKPSSRGWGIMGGMAFLRIFPVSARSLKEINDTKCSLQRSAGAAPLGVLPGGRPAFRKLAQNIRETDLGARLRAREPQNFGERTHA